MTARVMCGAIGYLFGNFLTGELVCRVYTGKSAKYLGTSGNPGMANVMAHIGFVPGLMVLAGDLLKCVLACLLARALFAVRIGRIAVWYTGLGAVLGHNYPVWMKFKGGKGVAATCLMVVIFSPLWGFLCNIAGMLVVFATHYLCLGAVVIPTLFVIPAFALYGAEAGCIALVLAAVMFVRNWKNLRQIPEGTCEKVDVLGAIKRKFGRKRS